MSSMYKTRLVEFYKKFNPEKVPMADQILEAYKGREDQLFAELESRYKASTQLTPAASGPSQKANIRKSAQTKPKTIDKKIFSERDEVVKSVTRRIQDLYREKMRPVEESYMYDKFYETLMDDKDFEAKPMVLLVGQYSVGKTSFIRYLLEADYIGMRIGPEPTTDKFIAVMYNEVERCIPGNAAAVSGDLPFGGLQQFGSGFLNRFEVVHVNSPVLQQITFIDTPGILSGEKQRINRNYDFAQMIRYFSDRADRILLLFDAHKLDISDEMKEAILAMQGNDDKVRVVLNKADGVDKQQLMRIYGALMWALGRVINNPEVVRVYMGSFWDEPLRFDYFKDLFAAEQIDLFSDLRSLPHNSLIRRINDLVRRARVAKAHALVLSHLRNQMPKVFKKQQRQQELIDDLPTIFKQLQNEHRLAPSDFPPLERFRDTLSTMDFTTFPKFDKLLFQNLEEVLSSDIPEIMSMLPKPTVEDNEEMNAAAQKEADNPFAQVQLEKGVSKWAIPQAHKQQCDETFMTLKQVNGKATGSAVKEILTKTDLSTDDLRKIWTLSDVDGDGKMDAGEFAVCMWLANERMAGKSLPDELPEELIPPSKRTNKVF